ncbi:ER membrane protein complex subunit 8 [Tetranychus urticae]|uniref:MPN domain-containing protein n=1 Tax=Tetranychus urticae TaxID=32264 RepID=T1KNA2_TETUR|nr:ER membrane protein complex subunit 8 [Tetranychus urticae]
MECQISIRCFSKIMMHSLKYPYYTINGVLLAEKRTSKDKSSFYYVVDCIPLFHMAHGLTPCMEIALLQVASYCKENNLIIAGYYQANKDYYDSTPDFFASKIGEKIWENNNDAIVLMVNSFGINFSKDFDDPNEINETLHVYQFIEGKWKHKSNGSIEKPEAALDVIRDLVVKKQVHLKLNDFDNHLDDITCDWRNNAINQEIKSLEA